MRTALKLAAIYVAIAVFLVLLWLPFASFSSLPSTPVQWLLLLLLAPLIHMLGEAAGSMFMKNRVSHFVEKRTASKKFSAMRVLYLFVAILAFIALLTGAAYLWRLVVA